MKDLRIALVQDRPDQPFYPGSTVTGAFLVDVNEPKSYKYISIEFLGRAYVHWTKTEVCYSSSEVYADVRQTLWTADESPDGRLAPGQYSFPFRFDIPPNAPSSFEGTVGSIRYELHGRIGTGLLKFDRKIAFRVPVRQVVRISDPRLLQPARQEVHKTLGYLLRSSAPIVLAVTVPKAGYCVGERVPVHVYIENGSSCRVTLSASLRQSVVYTAEGRRQNSKRTLLHIESDRIAPHVTHEWDSTLNFPATEVLDERSCFIIQMSYYLKVAALIPWGINLSAKIPLMLGNVRVQPPLGESATLPLHNLTHCHLPPTAKQLPPHSQPLASTNMLH